LYDGDYYVHGLGLIAKTDSQDGQLYYLADGLASTTGLTDGQGDVVGTYTYDVFGAIRSEAGGQTNDYRFTGQRCDLACRACRYNAKRAGQAHALFSPADRLNGRLQEGGNGSRKACVLCGLAGDLNPAASATAPLGGIGDR
jgi:hypothetical protein